MDTEVPQMKPVVWVGYSREDLKALPAEVQYAVGEALRVAQSGEKSHAAKPLTGFSGASVLEIVKNFQTDTYRVVYTVRFPDAVYVLHAFKKKSRSGISTPRNEMDLIQSRLLQAQELFLQRQEAKRRKEP